MEQEEVESPSSSSAGYEAGSLKRIKYASEMKDRWNKMEEKALNKIRPWSAGYDAGSSKKTSDNLQPEEILGSQNVTLKELMNLERKFLEVEREYNLICRQIGSMNKESCEQKVSEALPSLSADCDAASWKKIGDTLQGKEDEPNEMEDDSLLKFGRPQTSISEGVMTSDEKLSKQEEDEPNEMREEFSNKELRRETLVSERAMTLDKKVSELQRKSDRLVFQIHLLRKEMIEQKKGKSPSSWSAGCDAGSSKKTGDTLQGKEDEPNEKAKNKCITLNSKLFELKKQLRHIQSQIGQLSTQMMELRAGKTPSSSSAECAKIRLEDWSRWLSGSTKFSHDLKYQPRHNFYPPYQTLHEESGQMNAVNWGSAQSPSFKWSLKESEPGSPIPPTSSQSSLTSGEHLLHTVWPKVIDFHSCQKVYKDPTAFSKEDGANRRKEEEEEEEGPSYSFNAPTSSQSKAKTDVHSWQKVHKDPTANYPFEQFSVQSDCALGWDSDDNQMETEPCDVTACVNYQITNTEPANSPPLQILIASDSGPNSRNRRRNSRCLPRSQSVPSLSQITNNSAENKAFFPRSASLPELLLKSSFEEFTPDITVEVGDDESYRFQCSCPGLYQCSVTNLVFNMSAEGEVVYRTVPWNRRLLAQHHKRPAGPLFDIECLQKSVCELYLPHCEIWSTGRTDYLSVAHLNEDESIEFIRPHKVTETHVVINITGFSAFGNVKDEDSPPDPVRALVLLFYKPPAEPNPRSFLNVFMLPRNVVLRNVLRTWKETNKEDIYIITPPHCKLHPNQEYTLSTSPDDDLVRVRPKKAEFDSDNYDNYYTSFQVYLKKIVNDIELFLRDTTSNSVWEGEVCLSSEEVKRLSALNLRSSEKLLKMWSSFVKGISGPNLKSLLDELFAKKVINSSERESAEAQQDRADKARYVIDIVTKKGEAASSKMIEFLCELDPYFSEDLGFV